jgi:glycosyltransferase involved in cell wall biosynthesis
MKILHVIHSVNPATGGPIEGVKQLSAARCPRSHQIEIASLDAPDAPYLSTCPLRVHALGPGHLKYGFAPEFLRWLQNNAKKYDVVIVNGLWQFHGLATWRALRGSATPYVVFTHGMLDPWFKKRYPLKHLKKWLYWPWAEYWLLRDANAVLFTCEEERLLARQSFWLYRCNEIVVKYGTAGPKGDPAVQRAAFFQKFPQLNGKRLILFLGRIHPKKACDLLIQAFAKTMAAEPDWHLVMAGPDQIGWQAKLSKEAAKLGIAARITWTGMISGDLKWGAYHAADAFALPSHQENFGIVVAEALACGLPVLISDKVNIWREIEADRAGFVGKDDLKNTVAGLSCWMNLSETERLQMRERARACFLKRFEIKGAAETLTAVLRSVISQSPRDIAEEAASLIHV